VPIVRPYLFNASRLGMVVVQLDTICVWDDNENMDVDRQSDSFTVLSNLADRLSDETRSRPIILFLGAGVTMFLSEFCKAKPEGWNTWSELARLLAEKLGLTADVERLKGIGSVGLEHCFGYMLSLAKESYYDALAELLVTPPEAASFANLVDEMQNRGGSRRWNLIQKLIGFSDGVVTTNFDAVLAAQIQDDKSWYEPYYLDATAHVPKAVRDGMVKRGSAFKHMLYLHGGIRITEHDSIDVIRRAAREFILDFHSFVRAYPAIEFAGFDNEIGNTTEGITRTRFLYDLSRRTELVFIGHNISDYLIRSAITFGILSFEYKQKSSTNKNVLLINQNLRQGCLSPLIVDDNLRNAISKQFLVEPVFYEELTGLSQGFSESPSTSIDSYINNSTLKIGSGLDTALSSILAHIESNAIIRQKSIVKQMTCAALDEFSPDPIAALIAEDTDNLIIGWFFEYIEKNLEGLQKIISLYRAVENHHRYSIIALGWLSDNYHKIANKSDSNAGPSDTDTVVVTCIRALVSEFDGLSDSNVVNRFLFCLMRLVPTSSAAFFDLIRSLLFQEEHADFALQVLGRCSFLLPPEQLHELLFEYLTPISAREINENYGAGAYPHLRPSHDRFLEHGYVFIEPALVAPLMKREDSTELINLNSVFRSLLRACATAEKEWYELTHREYSLTIEAPPEDHSVDWWNTLEGEDARLSRAAREYPILLVDGIIQSALNLVELEPQQADYIIESMLDGEWLHEWRIALHLLKEFEMPSQSLLYKALVKASSCEWELIRSGVRHELWNLLNARATLLEPSQLAEVLTYIDLSGTKWLDERVTEDGADEEEYRKHLDYMLWLFLHPLAKVLETHDLGDWKYKLGSLNNRGYKLRTGDTLAGGIHSLPGPFETTDITVGQLEDIFTKRSVDDAIVYLIRHPARRNRDDFPARINNSRPLQEFVTRDPKRGALLLKHGRAGELHREYISAIWHGVEQCIDNWRPKSNITQQEVNDIIEIVLALKQFSTTHVLSQTDDSEYFNSSDTISKNLLRAESRMLLSIASNVTQSRHISGLLSLLYELMRYDGDDIASSSYRGKHNNEWQRAPYEGISSVAGRAYLVLFEKITSRSLDPETDNDTYIQLECGLVLPFELLLDAMEGKTNTPMLAAICGVYSGHVVELAGNLGKHLQERYLEILGDFQTRKYDACMEAFISGAVHSGGASKLFWEEFKNFYLFATSNPPENIDIEQYVSSLGSRAGAFILRETDFPGSTDLAFMQIELLRNQENQEPSYKGNTRVFKNSMMHQFIPREKENTAETWRASIIPGFVRLFEKSGEDWELACAIGETFLHIPKGLPLTELSPLVLRCVYTFNDVLEWHCISDMLHLVRNREKASADDVLALLQIANSISEKLVEYKRKHGDKGYLCSFTELPQIAKLAAELTDRNEITSLRDTLICHLELLGYRL
jgi:hypothetical protein